MIKTFKNTDCLAKPSLDLIHVNPKRVLSAN